MAKDIKQELKEEYNALKEVFGVNHSIWNMLYETYNPHVFCPANRARIIGMYLVLEDFARRAKENGVIYYYGINEFLCEYHDAVYKHIKLD